MWVHTYIFVANMPFSFSLVHKRKNFCNRWSSRTSSQHNIFKSRKKNFFNKTLRMQWRRTRKRLLQIWENPRHSCIPFTYIATFIWCCLVDGASCSVTISERSWRMKMAIYHTFPSLQTFSLSITLLSHPRKQNCKQGRIPSLHPVKSNAHAAWDSQKNYFVLRFKCAFTIEYEMFCSFFLEQNIKL